MIARMITLHYHPGNASFTPHALLHEIGVPFRLQLVDRARAEHKGAAYLKLNPNGTIPVLVDDGLVLYETAAIAMHLADRFPQARLAPAVGTAERAQFYKWMVWLTNTLQARLMHYFYPDRLVAEGNAEGAAQVKARAEHDIVGMLQQLDDLLASHSGPWLLGADYGAADVFAAMLGRWTRGFESRPARDFAQLGPWLQRVIERPALQRTLAGEGLAKPWF